MKIVVDGISKKYVKDKKDITVLNDLSAAFESGKMYAIIGKSGEGKSTLLKCLGTLLSIDKGSITFDNIKVNELSDVKLSEFRNDKIGIVFQEYNLLEFLNTYENVAMPLIIDGTGNFDSEETKKKSFELLDFVGLKDRYNHKPCELSGGEQQRVAIARALINNPDLILADEPTGSIDKVNTANILELLKKISKDKCVIVVTHDDQVLKYADVIYSMEEGKLVPYEVER